MRLLHIDSSGGLISTDFSQKTIPPYAILSHTWGNDEFLFEDIVNGTGKGKAGYEKILFCGEQAARDHLQYFWVDTCCIDKWNLRELSHAINSMFRWYKDAAKCYAFLSDVSTPTTNAQQHLDTWVESFRKSRWFTRGWTLQELLAPTSVEFFSLERHQLGNRSSLEQQIHAITHIPVRALRGDSLDEFSVHERMTWMQGRETKEEEDRAYALVGVFNVFMEFNYGEGKIRALKRLQEEIEKANTTPFIVPFDRNTRFIGRELELAELEKKLFVGTSTTKVAIIGPGGIGKTQLALEVAYRTRKKFEKCSVFWIPASDKESVYQAYAHIARRLNAPGWDDEKVDVKKLVQLHLSKESAGQWLLIIDNVDDAGLEPVGPSKVDSLIQFLPSSKQGAVVFTITDQNTTMKFSSQDVVKLSGMEPEMAQKMLEMLLVDPTDEQDKADLLLKELAHLPLAIVQAAAYIKVIKIKLQEYRSLLIEKKRELMESLDHEFESVVAATWLISFEQIRRHNKSAADYLMFMACIDRNDIPLALLPAASPPEQGTHAVETLHTYSFVNKRTAESSLDLHRLVHISTRNWLQSQDLLEKQSHIAIVRLLEVFPADNHGSRSKWRRLLPHAKFALSYGLTGQDSRAKINLAWKCALVLLSDGRWKEAEELIVQVIETRKRVLGEEHPATLSSMDSLSSTYWNQGRRKEAEELGVQLVETRKRVLGEEHPNTLISMANLASTYRDQGRWKEAEELELQVVEMSKRVLGEEHPDTLTSMHNLASTYWNQGRWNEAEELEVQVVETRKKMFDEEHPDTLTIMANLASTYREQGRWKEAEELGAQVVETRKRVLGEEHPNTLASMHNLASTYWNQGRWKEAEELGVQVIETRKKVLGEEHPDMLTSMDNLASTYWSQGQWKEAEELGVRAMDMRKRVLGEEHPDTLISMDNLSSTFWNQGRRKEAEELRVQVMETRKSVLGEEHPDTLTSMHNLASMYWNQGRWKEAEELGVQVVEMRKRLLGEEHPNTLTSMANLASTYRDQGRWKEAEGLEMQVMNTRKRVLGEGHPSTLTVMANLASTYWNQGRWKEAEKLEVEVLEKRKRVLGEEHPDTLTSMSNLAYTLKGQDKVEAAITLIEQVLHLRRQVFGQQHPLTESSLAALRQWKLDNIETSE